MSGYTPGKWRWVSRAGGWDGVDAVSGEQICRLEYNNPENARLIAAAPDLLEALEQCAIWHEEQDKAISKQPNANIGDNGWRRAQHQEQRYLARAAIALATGGSNDA